MKKYLCSALSLLALTLMAIPGFAQDNTLFRHIAPDANAVYRINLPSLLSKVNWEDIMARIPAGKRGKGQNQEMMELMKDPGLSGIDIHGDILVSSSGKDPMDSASYTTMILHLADSSKFRIALRKGSPGLRIVRHADKSYSIYKNKIAITWNNELAVVVTVKPPVNDALSEAVKMGKMDIGAPKGKDAGMNHPAPAYAAIATARSVAALKGWASTALMDDPSFKTTFSNDADIQVYTQKTNSFSKAFQKMIPAKALGGLNLDSLSVYRNSCYSIWFGDGKITMRSTASLTPQVREELAKFTAPALNADLLARVPKGNLLGVASYRVNLSAIGYMLSRLGLHDKLDSALATKNLSLADIGNAFTGDFLFAAVAPPQTDSFQKPKPAIYVVTSINDPSALHKLSEMLKSAKDSTGDDSTGRKATTAGKIKNNFAMRDNILVYSGSKELAEGYFSNTEKRNVDLLTEGMKENPLFLWIDLNMIVNTLMGPVRPDDGGDKKMQMLNGLHVLDKLIFSVSPPKDGEITSYLELSVTKKDQNILKTILNMIPAK